MGGFLFVCVFCVESGLWVFGGLANTLISLQDRRSGVAA